MATALLHHHHRHHHIVPVPEGNALWLVQPANLCGKVAIAALDLTARTTSASLHNVCNLDKVANSSMHLCAAVVQEHIATFLLGNLVSVHACKLSALLLVLSVYFLKPNVAMADAALVL